MDHADISGYLINSEDNVSALLQRLREQGSPLFATAEQILGYRMKTASESTLEACMSQ